MREPNSEQEWIKQVLDTDSRLVWQLSEIKKVPLNDASELMDEYKRLRKGAINANPNLMAEFIINEYSIRNGNGKKFHKNEREQVVYSHVNEFQN